MRLYRVHAYLPTARAGENGHPLFVWPRQGSGRIDNPGEYLTLYAAAAPSGAVGEVFGDHAIWTDDLLQGPPALSGSVKALTEFEGDPTFIDLDDASTLLSFGMRPSEVVTRHRPRTQAWASAMYATGSAQGLRWWSYHEPDWAVFGFWDAKPLTIVKTTVLTPDHFAVIQARRIMHRPWKSVP